VAAAVEPAVECIREQIDLRAITRDVRA
jgi:hypothetical protein